MDKCPRCKRNVYPRNRTRVVRFKQSIREVFHNYCYFILYPRKEKKKKWQIVAIVISTSLAIIFLTELGCGDCGSVIGNVKTDTKRIL